MRLYTELAPWYPLLTPPGDDYRQEAHWLKQRLPGVREALELGCGAGHLAHHLPGVSLTLTDISEPMLAHSRRLNPQHEHRLGDMRGLRLDRTFDAVYVHDAISYLLTEDDLAATFATARAHLRPGGRFVAMPDDVAETYEDRSDDGGVDGPDGRGLRYLHWDLQAAPDLVHGHFALLLRHADGRVEHHHDVHPFGLFPRGTWLRLLEAAGFEVDVEEDPWGRDIFLCDAR